MFRKLLFYLVFGNIIVSCTFFKTSKLENKTPIARVNEVYLYKEDVNGILPDNFKKKDSVLLVRNYINIWAKQQLLLNKAKINLKDNTPEIDKLVAKYQQDLLINKYREAIVAQNLDTVVSMRDIDAFYQKNKEILVLKEKIVKLKFLQIGNDIIDKEKIIALFKSDDEEDIDKLKSRELEFKSFYFDDSTWIKYTDVLRFLPMLDSKDFESIQRKSFLQKEYKSDLYLIKINNKIDKNNIAPTSYVIPTIKQMILHTRKLELLKNIEKTLLIDANKNGEYEIYK